MKKVAYSLLVFTVIISVLSCKNETKSNESSEISEETNELALAEKETETTPDFLYVTASSGLTLREHNNLNSEKLGVMPYGTKIKVIAPEDEETMTIGGIRGAMHQIEYNQKTGYAFNGYLSRFFPPEEDIKAKIYADDLKGQFPGVSFTETSGGTASKPTNTETLVLPTDKWHEVFYIAAELFDIPKSFAYPNPKGSNEETVKEKDPKSGTWTSQLTVNRKNNNLEKINYDYRTEGYGYSVDILQEGNKMKLERTEMAD
ncbi:SH3 domain-containing protein [Marixanthomonas ophiurae]|uniref:SH3 domain-containing protein n=1 Tax=Marixanthomonas ophiurae TaxID=387659 RepID=A0A3E1QAY3_9FLAO|nr:SH3 domain-containing protein [Marixanthomonas ophiurae]RFN59264.1 SH3 domain-containing protein [Marixanthomonas ophiurae]